MHCGIQQKTHPLFLENDIYRSSLIPRHLVPYTHARGSGNETNTTHARLVFGRVSLCSQKVTGLRNNASLVPRPSSKNRERVRVIFGRGAWDKANSP